MLRHLIEALKDLAKSLAKIIIAVVVMLVLYKVYPELSGAVLIMAIIYFVIMKP